MTADSRKCCNLRGADRALGGSSLLLHQICDTTLCLQLTGTIPVELSWLPVEVGRSW